MRKLIIVLSLLVSFNGWAEDALSDKGTATLAVDTIVKISNKCAMRAMDIEAALVYKQKGFSLNEIKAILKPDSDMDKVISILYDDKNSYTPRTIGMLAYGSCMKNVDEVVENAKKIINRL